MADLNELPVMTILLKRVSLLGLLLAIVSFSGCINLEPQASSGRYYVLSSLDEPGEKEASEQQPLDGELIIGLLPVVVPKYLDTTRIALRRDTHELSYTESDRWAEPLDLSIAQSLRYNLISDKDIREVNIFPWPEGNKPDYTLQVRVEHFEGTTDGIAILETHWTLYECDDGKLITEDKTRITRRWNTQSYANLVSALSEACRSLAEEIAANLPD